MSAGLLAFKLCDREFDCEHCPLDAALAGTPPHAEAPGSQSARARLDYRYDRRYSSSHAWVQALEGARVRCGVDALAARLLDQVSHVVLPPVGSRVRRGEPSCWLIEDSETIPYAAPLDGTVVRVNSDVQADPALMAKQPYDEGWLIEIECAGEAQGEDALLACAEARRCAAHDLRALRHQLARCAASADPRVGPTLNDGGRRLRDPRRVLGAEALRKLVRRFLR